jgi:hypothetical protein
MPLTRVRMIYPSVLQRSFEQSWSVLASHVAVNHLWFTVGS